MARLSPEDFATTYGPLADDISGQTGLHPSIVLGTIAQETGWGNHFTGNNVFGISPGGKVASYPTIEAGAQAYVDLINSRYKVATTFKDPATQAKALVKLGYNTADLTYASKVTDLGSKAHAQHQETTAPSADDLFKLVRPAPGQAPPEPAGTPSVDDLLKLVEVAPQPPPKQAETDSDKLMVPGPKAPNEPHAPNLMAGYQPGWRERAGNWIGDTASKIGETLGTSYANAPGLLTPGAQAAVEGVPYVGPVLGTATGAAGTLLRLGAAGFAGTQAGVAAAGDVASPGLGRELAAGMEVAPFYPRGLRPPPGAMGPAAYARAVINEPNMLQPRPPPPQFGPPPPPASPAFVPPGGAVAPQFGPPQPPPAMIPPRTTLDPLTGVERPIVTPEPGALPPPRTAVTTTEPVPGMPGGAQRSAGAMGTPVDQLPPQTRGEFLKGLQSAVEQTAEDRAGPGLKDDHVYVEGIPRRLLAQRDFSDSKHALDHKTAFADDTRFRNEVEANKRERNAGMVDQIQTQAGDANSLFKLHEDRAEGSPHEMGVFINERPVDIADFAAQVKAAQGRKRSGIRTILDDVYRSLFDENGKLETAPSVLYEARQNITDYLKKGVKGIGEQADNVRAAKSILESFLDPLDKKITEGAPRFQEYRDQWAAKSRVIDRQEFLQSYLSGTKNIKDKDGYLIPSKVQKMLDDIYQQNKADGVQKAKSLTPAEIDLIAAVRNELATQQLHARLAAVPGSDTFQQIQNEGRMGSGLIGTGAKAALGSLLHAGTLGTATKMGEIVVRPAMEARRQRAIEAKIAARKAELLSTGEAPFSGTTIDQSGNLLNRP